MARGVAARPQAGGFNPGDASELLGGEEAEPTYEGRRRQQARAEVRRVLREAEIEDERFFDGKVAVSYTHLTLPTIYSV